MFSSLSSFYENIRSYSITGSKAGDKRRREREEEGDVIITDVLQTPPAKRLRNIEEAAHESDSNSPILNFSEFVKRVTWSGRYIWNYVVRGETACNNSESSLSRDLEDAEEEMEKFQTSDMGMIHGSAGTRDYLQEAHSGLRRRPLIKDRGYELTLRTTSTMKPEWPASASPKQHSKNKAGSSGKPYDASKYKDISDRKANGPSQYHNTTAVASWNLPDAPKPSVFSKRYGQRRQTPARKSPVNRSSRFISTAERVVRLEERDRYKQLVAQFTTLETPDCTGQNWNARSDDTLCVQTDFLAKTRCLTRSGDGSLISPRSKVSPSHTSFTAPASPPRSPTRLRVTASPRSSANRASKLTQDISLYSRPGPREVSSVCRDIRSSAADKSVVGNPFDEEWTRKWKDLLSEGSLQRQREITKEERKLKAIKQKREEETQALKHEVQKRSLKGWDYEEEEEEEEVAEDSFLALTPEMEQMVDAALGPGYADDPLVEGFRVTLKRSDIATLSHLNWLNDEIINFFFNLLVERSNQQGKIKVHAFNSFFYPKLIKSGYASLKRWTKKVDIFAMDLVLVPVHLGMHWCLAAVDFNKNCISYYDSLKGSNPQCLSALRAYLNEESLDKKKVPFDLNGWKTSSPKDIPEQLNGCDCGVFACTYAEYLSRGAKFDFDQRHMPYFRRRMVYEIVTKKLL